MASLSHPFSVFFVSSKLRLATEQRHSFTQMKPKLLGIQVAQAAASSAAPLQTSYRLTEKAPLHKLKQ